MWLNSQLFVDNIKKNKQRMEAMKIADRVETIEGKSDLSHIKWVGDSTATKLFNAWIKTQKHLAKAGEEKMEEIITNEISIGALKRWFKELTITNEKEQK